MAEWASTACVTAETAGDDQPDGNRHNERSEDEVDMCGSRRDFLAGDVVPNGEQEEARRTERIGRRYDGFEKPAFAL